VYSLAGECVSAHRRPASISARDLQARFPPPGALEQQVLQVVGGPRRGARSSSEDPTPAQMPNATDRTDGRRLGDDPEGRPAARCSGTSPRAVIQMLGNARLASSRVCPLCRRLAVARVRWAVRRRRPWPSRSPVAAARVRGKPDEPPVPPPVAVPGRPPHARRTSTGTRDSLPRSSISRISTWILSADLSPRPSTLSMRAPAVQACAAG